MFLTNFPSELLESIIYYTLPDLTDVRWSGNEKAVYALYASPILQVNRLLKQIGFTVINTKYTWIHVHIPWDFHVRLVRKCITRGIPIVPPWLQPHISSNAPKVHVQVTWGKTRSQHEPTHDEKDCRAIMLPYNFDILLQLWNVIDTSSVRITSYATVKFWYANMSSSLEQHMRDLVSPTRAMLHFGSKLDVWYEGSLLVPWDARTLYPVKNDMACLTELLEIAESLAQKGHREEAGLLMLYSRSKLRYIDDRTSSLDRFHRFEELSGTPAQEYFDLVLRPSNQICHMFWHLNQGASLTFVRLYLKYGHEWYSRRDQKPIWLYPSGTRIRLNDWYGLSSSEQVKWHCRRAIEVEAACDMKRKDPTESDSLYKWGLTTQEILEINLLQALIEVDIARLVDPKDECARRLQLRYMEALTGEEAKAAEHSARSYYESISVTGLRSDKTERQFFWKGDNRMFRRDDAGVLLRHTLLAREGIEAGWPSYVACLDSLILDCVEQSPPKSDRLPQQ